MTTKLIPLSELSKKLSAWGAVALTIFALIEPHVEPIRDALPDSWAAGFGVLILILRAIRQSNDSSGPAGNSGNQPGSPPASTSSRTQGGLASFSEVTILLACLAIGCDPNRPPERDPCYLAAEAHALRRYAGPECEGYSDPDDCPADADIQDELQREQEACP